MVTALETTYLSWDLVSPKEYVAGSELQCTLSFAAPKVGKYYLLGALYDTALNYISGTLFGALLPEGSDYAVNNMEHASLWELEADEKKDLPCTFTFNRTDVVLGLFLMRMVGDSPSLEDDGQVASLSMELSSPMPPITFESLIPLVMVVSMCGFMTHEALKN